MSTFAVKDVKAIVSKAAAAMVELEQELNAADAKLGDGDTGGMLARVISAIDKAAAASDEDVGACFSAYAKAAAVATGSSLGTLFATALMTFAKGTKGHEAVPLSELAPLFAKARDAMMARGGAALGDKTVLDAIDAVARALEGVSDPLVAKRLAVEATQAALLEFHGRPNKIGRARMFADQTIGLDDPGMLAFAKLCKAVA
ncbi:dihydroxyacetone kinase-like protein [Rhizobium subbaraonis]|uniref:Dihydroxyacetone kinase-like protein n=1 Tax=Rhizobium subbaraonis TaxID=908946 RepID=A0A285UT67_9HYPH|nr:DAK2 domain-containing protein [Rhizobium subbaraonis]SOC45125.1 dihydroxyacetone kinase-like protein [Rhizobium subbaraonis]